MDFAWTRWEHVGINAFRQSHLDQGQTYPDRHYTITQLIAAGDKVVAMLEYCHSDPTTSQTIESTGINVYRISSGKMQEFWPV